MTLTRIYMDDRFPEVQIRNHGGATFNVWCKGECTSTTNDDGWYLSDAFTHYGSEKPACAPNPAEVEAIAQEFFDDMAEADCGNPS